MSRYFIRRAKATMWVGDDIHPCEVVNIPTVCDHDATDTGLVDENGNAIMRAPRAIGFGRRDEW